MNGRMIHVYATDFVMELTYKWFTVFCFVVNDGWLWLTILNRRILTWKPKEAK